uniref:tRNA (N6-isopentenyl adenosine(37)-C2)-methylthiotransferase MiaB n=1 Tax=uncultured Bilophila sp. TaxID=529385 RepID=UPI0025F333A4|nr:tRNA (N6-isopentenyl adenosine(37)-C2)-methylthiotransferase MiaB [uncultured Bilophila sp.]
MAQGTFHIITFGCQMNVNDSFWLSRSLQRRGFVESPLEQAEIVILNTCSVRDKPEQKVYAALGRIKYETSRVPNSFAVVAGCVAQQIGAGFFERFPQVRLVVGGDGLAMAPDAIERLHADPALRLNLTDFSEVYPERDPALPAHGEGDIPPVAYVNIMQGCDNFCTYCIVPFTRGRQKSRSPEAILDECRALIDNGAKEITLLGQNVNSYGLDKHASGDTSFAQLLRRVAELPGLARLRFVTPHPKDLSPDVIAMFAELPNLCPRLHLPLQAGSDRVLARMNRKYDMARYMSLVEALRTARPDIALSTDLIVGFPGETEEQFQETLAAVRAVDFMSSFSFCYSDRPGTAASRHEEKVEPAEKLHRLERLQALQEGLSSKWLKARVGCETEVLLEGVSRKQDGEDAGSESWQGRDPWGDAVNVSLPSGVGAPGLILPVRIVADKKHSLVGEVRK